MPSRPPALSLNMDVLPNSQSRVCEGGVAKAGMLMKNGTGSWNAISSFHICRKDETGLLILQWWCQPAYMTACGESANFLFSPPLVFSPLFPPSPHSLCSRSCFFSPGSFSRFTVNDILDILSRIDHALSDSHGTTLAVFSYFIRTGVGGRR